MTQFHDDLDGQLDRLREILLSGDREEIRKLKDIIERQEELSKRVKPIIDKEVAHIKNDFSNTFGKEVEAEFEKKLRLSEGLLIQVLAPIMGKMIKKYLSKEMQKIKDPLSPLSDNIIQSVLSFLALKPVKCGWLNWKITNQRYKTF